MTKFCNQCGAEVAEAQKFCNKCGTRLLPTSPAQPPPAAAQPPYQPTYQAPPSSSAQMPGQMPGQMPYQGGYAPPVQQPPPYGNPAAGGLAANLVAALCYLVPLIGGVVFLVIDPYNKDRFVRFHAWQSIFYGGAWFAFNIIRVMLYFILPNFLAGMLGGLVSLGFFIGWIWLMVQAYQNKREKLPVIGDLAEQQAR